MQHHRYALHHQNNMTMHRIFDEKQPDRTVALVTTDSSSTAAALLLQSLNAQSAIPKLALAGVPAMIPFPAVFCRIMDLVVVAGYSVLNDDDREECDRAVALDGAIGEAMTILGISEEALQKVHGDSLDWLAELHTILEPQFPHWYRVDGDEDEDGEEDVPAEFVVTEEMTLDELTRVYVNYCSCYGLPDVSADEQEPAEEHHQRWLANFIDHWNAAEKRQHTS